MVGLAREATVQPQWHGGVAEVTGRFSRCRTLRQYGPRHSRRGSGLDLSRQQARTTLGGTGSLLEGVAAVIIDYSHGGRYAAPTYQDELAKMARAAGVLWIADEVETGFGKCGQSFNFQWGKPRPDIVTLGKPMGGSAIQSCSRSTE
jgi:4-aminobutyrate aminotransferase-like enzyme